MHRILGKAVHYGGNLSSSPLVQTTGAMLSSSKGDYTRSFGKAVVLEEVHVNQVKKNEKSSGEEQANVVETFILRHMSLNQGKLPSITTVVKELGCSREVVRDKYNALQGRKNLKDAETVKSFKDLESPEDKTKSLNSEGFEVLASLASSLGHLSEAVTAPSNDVGEKASTKFKDADVGVSSSESLKSSKKIRNVKKEEQKTLWERLNAVTTPEERSDKEDEAEFKDLDYPEQEGTGELSYEKVMDAPNMQIPRNEVFVTFLPLGVTAADVENAFRDCGEVLKVNICHPSRPLLYQYRFGFVRFDTEESARKALEKKITMKGMRVRVFPKKTSNTSSISKSVGSNREIAKHGGPKHSVQASYFSSNIQKPPDCEGYQVFVENIPESFLPELKEALASHGEVISSYFKADDFGAATAFINFKSAEAKEKALAAHWVHLGGQLCRVSRLDSPKTTVVRISNVPGKIDEDRILNACKSCGYVEKIEPRTPGVLDIYFHPKESPNMIRILDRLNEVQMEKRRWLAQPAPRVSPHVVNEFLISGSGQQWVKSQQFQLIEKFDQAIGDAMLHLEDVKYLISLQWQGRSPDCCDASQTKASS